MSTTTANVYDGTDPSHEYKFVLDIKRQLEIGFGFVPFIGAGFSAPSGIPMVRELEGYIKRCICIVLAVDVADNDLGATVDRHEGAEGSQRHSWNPRTDKWPPFVAEPSHEEVRRENRSAWKQALISADAAGSHEKENWDEKIFGKIESLRKRVYGRGKPLTDREIERLRIYTEGFGAMQDWRTGLQFLARIEVVNRGTELRRVPPDPSVIDSFFRELIRGRQASLGHRMLGLLADTMRIDVILTTNFDNLLELAFETARNPLQVFEITPNSLLPSRQAVSLQRAIIKLHGGRMGLRADYSLDETLSDEEKDHYLAYFRSNEDMNALPRQSPSAKTVNDDPFLDRHMFVVGYSASDRRIWGLIRHAAAKLGKDFKVYWLCYTDEDRTTTVRILGNPDCEAIRHKFVILQCTQPGLLLFHLHQTLQKSLPALGSVFPSAARLTLPPLDSESIRSDLDGIMGVAGGKPNRLRIIEDLLKESDLSSEKIIFIGSEHDKPGGTSVCSELYSTVERSYSSQIPVWVDMNMITSTDNLFEVLLESIHYRLGVHDWIPFTMSRSNRPSNGDLLKFDYSDRVAELGRLMRLSERHG